MKKNTAYQSIIGLLMAYITLSFIPCLVIRGAYNIKPDGGVVTSISTNAENFFSQFSLDIWASTFMPKLSAFIAVITVLLVVAGIAGIGLMLINKENEMTKNLILAPFGALITHFIAAFILFVFEPSHYSPATGNTYVTSFAPMWGFFVQSAILLLAIGLIVLILLNKVDDEPIKPKKTNNLDNIESLKKYKELLDSGIITQEEFDAKKKQILNL